MREKLDSLAKHIRSSYHELERKAKSERNERLVIKVGKAPLSLSVSAVDGGLLAHRMHGADIVVSRAVAVNFVYDNSFKSFSHYPRKNPEPEIEIRNSLGEHEAIVFRSLVRLKGELSCAIASLSAHSPDLLLIDGSLLPLPSDRPAEDSELRDLYSEVISLYEKLYSLSKEKGCLLCGIIKDSRSRKLARELGLNCSDSMLCSFLLEEGERTDSRPYLDEKTSNKDVVFLCE